MENYSKVCKELSEIFKCMPKEEIEKLPEELKRAIEEKKDNTYEYTLKNVSDFENQEMMNETRAILAVLYRDYWASEEERNRMKKEEQEYRLKLEQSKQEKYKAEDIFNNTEKNKTETINKEETMALIERRETIFQKFIKFLKSLF